MRILILLILLMASPVFATTYYVDGDPGTDCSGDYSIANRTCTGSDGSSYNTLLELDTVASAGDTINVRGGTYTVATVTAWGTSTGTSGSPITIQSYLEESPIFDKSVGGSIFQLEGVSWVVIDDLEFTNTNGGGVHLKNTTNVTVKNCYFHDMTNNPAGAIYTTGVTDTIIENNLFEDINPNGLDSGAHALYMSSGTDTTVRNNVFNRSGGGPTIDMRDSTGLIYNNVVNNPSTMAAGDSRWCMFVTNGPVSIYNNTCYIDCDGMSTADKLDRCKGIDYTYVGAGDTIIIKNNIIYYINYDTNYAIKGGSATLDIDYNMYFSAVPALDVGVNSVQYDPEFTTNFTDFTLKSTSPAIDTGTNDLCPSTDILGVDRPLDGTCDMGAYEYSGAATPSVVNISQPDGIDDLVTQSVSADYAVTYTLYDNDSVGNFDGYYCTSGAYTTDTQITTNCTVITGCTGRPEGTDRTCTWTTDATALSTCGSTGCYVYGIARGESDINNVSSGVVTIQASPVGNINATTNASFN